MDVLFLLILSLSHCILNQFAEFKENFFLKKTLTKRFGVRVID